MMASRQITVFFGLIVALLFVQVGFSAALMRRLNDLEETINQRTFTAQSINQTESLPAYVENVSVDDDPSKGTIGAPITIVEFSDYECSYCAQAAGDVEEILARYEGKILFVYRDYPQFPNAPKAAEAAQCAGSQGKFWEMHDLLFANQNQLAAEFLPEYANQLGLDVDQFNECMGNGVFTNEVNRDKVDGETYQVRGTPTFFVNGYRIPGASFDALTQQIDALLLEIEN